MLIQPALGKCLQEARKRVRLSQTAIAKVLGVTRQVVSAFESGKRDVTAGELQILCNLFRTYPDDLLGFIRPQARAKAAAVDFRMNTEFTSLTEHDRHEVETYSRKVDAGAEAHFHRWFESYKRYSAVTRNPFGTVQQLTERIRADLGQQEPPINIYLLADHLGIVVTPTLLDKAAAIVIRADAGTAAPPRILVSSAQPLPRQRFSIGHELAHLLLHEEALVVHAHYYRRQSDQREVDADAFSAELIMPRDLLTKSIENLKKTLRVEEAVFLLSNLYQVSFLAMATRLYNLSLITRTVFNQLCKVKPSELEEASGKSGGGRQFDANRLLPKLIAELTVDNRLSRFDYLEVRLLQEIAFTRYIGRETGGGTNPAKLYELEPANKVYEKVVLWVADKYPLTGSPPQC